MDVVSLFNGCSGTFMALDDLGINVNKYYVSEIDKFANQAAKAVNPDSIFLGDVTKWKEWKIDWSKIDLICAGSPCQGFSFAGKQLAFDDPRSRLFFVFIDILNHCKKLNPSVKFFLENVDMKKQHMKVINDALGLSGQCLNSNLVSAQNRKRWYWTNISTRQTGLFADTETYIEPPMDRKIFLKDIVEEEVDEKYYIKNPKVGFDGMDLLGKCNTLRVGGGASQDKKHNFDIICVAQRGRNPDNPSDRTVGSPTVQRLEPQMDGKTNCLTSVQKDNYITNGYRLRRLTPKETMRLQTIPYKFQKILLESRDSDCKIAYICESNECLNRKICKKNAKLKDARIISQVKRLNSVVSTINDSKDMVLWSLQEERLTKRNAVQLKDVKGISNQLKVIASCTINDTLNMGLQSFQKDILSQMKSVSIAITKLGDQDQKECVQNISKCGEFMVMHYMLRINGESLGVVGIFEIQMELHFTEKSWSRTLKESLQNMKWSIISTWIKPIIGSVICTYAKTEQSMHLYMQNLEVSLEKVLKFHLCYLKTEHIMLSDTALYRMMGNGWTIEIIKEFFKQLIK